MVWAAAPPHAPYMPPLHQLTLDQTLTGLSWLLYLLIFASVVARFVARRTSAHLDMVLLFGATTLVIVLSAVQDVLDLPATALFAIVSGALLMVLPYLLLRLVNDFADVPTWLVRGAEAGLVLSIVALIAFQVSMPLPVTLLLVAYFVLLALYDAVAFALEGRRTRGVTRRRMQSAALGTVLLGLDILFAGLSAAEPGLTSLWSLLTTVAGAASAVAYYVAFAPPTWLRRAWQEPELRAFLASVAEIPRLPDLAAVQRAIEAGAAESLGAPLAALGVWDAERQTLAFHLSDEDVTVSAADVTSTHGPVSRTAQLVTNTSRDRGFAGPLLRLTRSRAAVAAPVRAGARLLGVLVALSPREPVFANSDLELVGLLADQAAAVLESRALIDEATAVRAHERAEQNFRLLAETMPQLVWTATTDGAIDYVNQGLVQFTGRRFEELVGHHWSGLIHPDDMAGTEQRWRQAVAVGEQFEMEFRLRSADGSYRWHLSRALPVRDDAGGAIMRWFGTATDIQEQKLAVEQAEAAVRARDEFLSIASHELRTPAAGIKGAAQMLLRARERGTADESRLERTLTSIDHAADRLSIMIGDLLDVSRLQTGRLSLRREPIDLVDLVEQSVNRFREQQGAQHDVSLSAEPAAHARVWADPVRIEQVVANLLENAAKYSPRGGQIEVQLAGSDDLVELAVHDHGIGLPPDAVESVFQPFGRTRTAVDSQIPGLGLGLYICRQIVTLHGGSIRADSPGEGQGTTLRVQLPRDPVSTPSSEGSAPTEDVIATGRFDGQQLQR